MVQGAPVNVLDYMTSAQIADVLANTKTLDVTAAVQAAISSDAGSIYFPQGTYLISSTLTCAKTGQEIFGAGNTSVIWYTGTSICFNFQRPIDILLGKTVLLSRLKITTPSDGYDGNINIIAAKLTSRSIGCIFKELYISRFGQGIQITSDGGNTYDVTVTDCYFQNCYEGIRAFGTAIYIQRNEFYVAGEIVGNCAINIFDAEIINISDNLMQGGFAYGIVIGQPNVSAIFQLIVIRDNFWEFSGGGYSSILIGNLVSIIAFILDSNHITGSSVNALVFLPEATIKGLVVTNNVTNATGIECLVGNSTTTNIVGALVRDNVFTVSTTALQARITNGGGLPVVHGLNKLWGSFDVDYMVFSTGISMPNPIPYTKTNVFNYYANNYKYTAVSGFTNGSLDTYYHYAIVASTVNMSILDITGTSNSAIFKLTSLLEVSARPEVRRLVPCRVSDNGGAAVWGTLAVNTDGTINIYVDAGLNGFTASGTKSAYACSFSYSLWDTAH
jgi:hypothetical protein